MILTVAADDPLELPPDELLPDEPAMIPPVVDSVPELQLPAKRFEVFVRHSPLAEPRFVIEAIDSDMALQRILADYPSVAAADISIAEVP